MAGEHTEHCLKYVFGVFACEDLGARGLELDLLEDVDDTAGDIGRRAAVLRGICVGLAGFARAGVLVVLDGVGVDVDRAPVELSLVGRDSLHVDAGVVLVEDAVAVFVSRAAVGLRIAGLEADRVDAGVVLVENAVAVLVSRTAVFAGIVVRAAGHHRAGVVLVEDAVAVAVFRATVLLRILARDPGHHRARVDRVEDAVAVAVFRAAVFRDVSVLEAKRPGAGVVFVEDTVAVRVCGGGRHELEARDPASLRRSEAARDTAATGRAEAQRANRIVSAQHGLEGGLRGGVLGDAARVAGGRVADDDGASEDLRADHEALAQYAYARGGCEVQLLAKARCAEIALRPTELHRDLACIREHADVAGGRDVRRNAHVSVARVAGLIAGRQPYPRADGEREGRLVLAEQAHVEADARVAEGLLTRGKRDRLGAEGRLAAVLEKHDRHAEADADAVEEVHGGAEVERTDVADGARRDAVVGPVDHHGAVLAVERRAERRTHAAAEVEAVVGEPLVVLFGRFEPVYRKPLLGRLRLRASGDGCRECGCRSVAHELCCSTHLRRLF